MGSCTTSYYALNQGFAMLAHTASLVLSPPAPEQTSAHGPPDIQLALMRHARVPVSRRGSGMDEDLPPFPEMAKRICLMATKI